MIYNRISNNGKALIGRMISALFNDSMVILIPSGPLKGMKWIPKSGVLEYSLGNFEKEKASMFANEISNGDVIYDIGANVGYYSLISSVLTGLNGKVIAFEPVPRNLSYLKENMRINNVKNVATIEAAVGEINGMSAFSLGTSNSTGGLAKVGEIQVRTVRLDDLVNEGQIPVPNCIKMDIEGGEHDALQGAKSLLSHNIVEIFLATHNQDVHERCLDLLIELQYTIEPIDHRDILSSRELYASNSQGKKE